MNRNSSYHFGEIRAIDEKELTITHVINTKVLDRYNTCVLPKGAIVKYFLQNPTVLWYHNLGKENTINKIPIGKCIKLEIDEEEMVTTTKFNKNNPLALAVFESYKDKFLRAWSIGFMPKKYTKYTLENRKELNRLYGLKIKEEQIQEAGFWGIYVIHQWELLEYSAVPVPGNPEALNNAESELEFEKQLAVRGLVLEMQEPKIKENEVKIEPEKAKEEKKDEVSIEKKEPIKIEETPKLEVKEEIKQEEPRDVITSKDIIGEDAPTELEQMQQESNSIDIQDEDTITLDFSGKKEQPKEEVKVEPEKKDEVKIEPEKTKEETIKEQPKVEVIKEESQLDARIKIIEESIASLTKLVADLANGTKVSIDSLTEKVVEIKKATSIDNIETLRELETHKSESQSEVFDWMGFVKRTNKGSK